MDVRDILWSEWKSEPKPEYYEYPTSGYAISRLYSFKDAEFFQVADLANKQRIYHVFLDGNETLKTTNRSAADAEYDRVKKIVRRRPVE